MELQIKCFLSLLCCVLVNSIPRIRPSDHYIDGKHNVEHDHKAFLDESERDTFKTLTPEESRLRLSEIVDKIDKDSNGNITKTELRAWMEYIQLKHLRDEVDKRFHKIDTDGDGVISWDEFKERHYGHKMDHDNRNVDEQYKKKREFDKRKYQVADSDHDNMLTKDEYSAYLHPGEYRRMHEIAAEETLKGIDKDKDGYLSLEEYIGDYGETEPDWVDEEREYFRKERDKDGDGKLNKAEVLTWLFPVNYNPLDAETEHLMYEADGNKDKTVTKREILDKQELFVKSKATNYGETLNRPVDEL
ncbi:calumenin-A-like [Dendronephthya gigantea]|uniref:calumenin-A-like n=1 Tax=Dendronephthya gigantea TaxID=151771 RepID=UPI00106CBC81|nr:calumenin-A-like [Dendronephthya gigantea]